MKTTYNPQNNLQVVSMDDIIFADRNHAYGAYYLRKNYNSFLIRSLMITVAFVAVLFLISKIAKDEVAPIIIDRFPDDRIIDIIPTEEPPLVVPPELPTGSTEALRGMLEFNHPVVVDNVSTDLTKLWVNDDYSIGGSPEGTRENGIPSYYSGGGGGGGNPIPDDEDSVFNFLEEPAIFPIGEFSNWVATNLKYDQDMVSMGIEGNVFFQFVINKKGYPEDVKITRGVDPGLDQEVIRVIMNSPKWIPGKQRGMPVKQLFSMKIKFRISR